MTNKLHKLLAAAVLTLTMGFVACGDGDDVDVNHSIFDLEGAAQQNDFDRWIYSNYVVPYNIDLKYHFEDIESDHEFNLAPADYDKSVRLAHIVKYAWLEAYDEVAGMEFTRTYVPKVLHLVGSPAYQNNGTMVLGTAEGGLKVTLYMVNNLRIEKAYLNAYYFKTMHHEFSHILHQNRNYDTDFDLITEADYISGDWYRMPEDSAHAKGFITPYAMSEPREDIAEVTCMYIIQDKAYWDKIYQSISPEAASKLLQKVNLVKSYMRDSWGIDMDELRSVVQRRMSDVIDGRVDLESLAIE